MHIPRFFFLLVFMGTMLSACSQTSATAKTTALPDLFVGSTPCDSLIRTILKIPPQATDDFIKWELRLDKSQSTGTFEMLAWHGEGQNGTNGFKGGGNKLLLKGSFTTGIGARSHAKAKVYTLSAPPLAAPILLMELNKDLFYFLAPNRQLIVGNGGFSYVLNRER
jgi:hypothetical protein